MFDSERQLGIIEDLLLPLDIATRYDVYFTDKRIAIVCMGRSRRVDSGASEHRSYLFGVAPEALTNPNEQRKNKQIIEEQIKELAIDEKLKLSKKSCFYAYDEIEEVKLVSGKNHKFVKTPAEASALSIKAGTDSCSGTTYKALPEALQRGLISEADLDRALRRLFTLRMRLGQFDPPARVPYARIPITENDSPAHNRLALEAARQSLVLLKNDGTLPWNPRDGAGMW